MDIIFALLVILVLVIFKFKFFIAAFAGIIMLALFNELTLIGNLNLLMQSVTSSTTINLVLIVITLSAFGNLIKSTGNLKAIVESVSRITKDYRYQVIFFPMLIGLLTFPGGAVFSAPLIEESGSRLNLNQDKLAVANIIFRHIFHPIYPLCPGLMALVTITQTDLIFYIFFHLPIFIISFYLAIKFIFKGIEITKERLNLSYDAVLSLLKSILPILVIGLLALVINNFPLAILAGIVLVMFSYLNNGISLPVLLKERTVSLWKGINWFMALAIGGILIFKDFLEVSPSLNNIVNVMLNSGIPLVLLAIIIPYISGIITGNNTASLGISLPFMLQVLPAGQEKYYLVLMFISSLVGYVGSPVHPCLVLTVEHFKASLKFVVKQLNLMGYVLALITLVYIMIAKSLF